MSFLDLADARRFIAADEKKAVELVIPYNNAVVDPAVAIEQLL